MPRPKKAVILPASRPLLTIDWKIVDVLLEAGCNGVEIAGHIGMHPDTLYERTVLEKGVTTFSAYAQEKKATGEARLRHQQYEEALGIAKNKGNTQHLSKLCETRLGQKNESDAGQTRAFIALFQRLDKAEAALLSRGIVVPEMEDEQSLLDKG